MSTIPVCGYCKQVASLKCSNCLLVYYCCKNHQKLDWKSHKSTCSTYKVDVNENLGRHLIAARYLSEGEIIIKEEPLIHGPPSVTPPICLGCYKLITEFNKVDCSKCGWPVCSTNCQNSNSHIPECTISGSRKNGKVKINTLVDGLAHPSYQCLTVLRCLYMKRAKPAIWRKLMNLQSHDEERKDTVKYNADMKFIANFITEFFGITEFSNREIMHVAGIVQVNAHEVPLQKPGYIAVYEKASLLEHSCRANCMKSFTSDGNLVIRAAKRISPGEHLSICYTDPLWCKTLRLAHLMETKFFLCRCIRCSDPTEMATHFNSVRCDRDCSGYSAPIAQIDDDESTFPGLNANYTLFWKCQTCNNISRKESKFLTEAKYEFSRLDKDNIDSCMKFIKKYEFYLHSNHNLLVNVKLALIHIFVQEDVLISLELKYLTWTIKTCKELYDLVMELLPAENRLIGVLLYHLQLVLMENGRRNATESLDAHHAERRENLMECQRILKEAYKFLRYEPEELTEGKMAEEAKRALQHMDDLCRVIHV